MGIGCRMTCAGAGRSRRENLNWTSLDPSTSDERKSNLRRRTSKTFTRKLNRCSIIRCFGSIPAKRQAIAEAFERAMEEFGHTVWSCSILRNHAHLLGRRHRDQGHVMWEVCAGVAREALQAFADVGPEHPVWSDRPYVVFVYDPAGVEGRIDYIVKNSDKEGLPGSNTRSSNPMTVGPTTAGPASNLRPPLAFSGIRSSAACFTYSQYPSTTF